MTRVVINGESLYSSSSHRLRAGVPPNVQLRRCASSASYSSSTSLSYASLMRMPFFSLDAASRVRSAVCRTAVLLGPAPIAVGRRRCGGSPWFCLEAGLSPAQSTTCPPHAGPPVKRSGSVFLSRGAAGALVRSLATQTRRRLG